MTTTKATSPPDPAFNGAELEALARIGARSPCARRWLEYFLPSHRYYVALGAPSERGCRAHRLVAEDYEPSLQARQAIILRLKDRAGLEGWLSRQWETFIEPPQISDATLVTLRLVEEIVARPARAQHRLTLRGYVNGGAVTLRAHLADSDPCWETLYDGEPLREIEERLRREGLVSPELPNALPLWPGAGDEIPWRLRAARSGDGPQRRGVVHEYVPPGCAIEQ